MPFYDINHSTPLTPHQRSSLAEKITSLHCETFSAPSIFVNIRFTGPQKEEEEFGKAQPRSDYPQKEEEPSSTTPHEKRETAFFVGGRPERPNAIFAHIRTRASLPAREKQEKLNGLPRLSIWGEVVRKDDFSTPRSPNGRLDDERALHTIFIMEDIGAGYEQGFVMPKAGDDGEWVKRNMRDFEGRAEAGDRAMERLVGEWKERI